ncbi:MAG: lysophospholipid acyltransferase family protein [Myxococcota bacterium]|nr:lysophospholipid acyltransferase family protein [Myxococcota bacterium]
MGRLSRVWRAGATGLAFAALGVTSLALGLVLLPSRRVLPGGRERAELRAQKVIHHAARIYLFGARVLGLMRWRCVDAERLREPGTLVVANHPTLLDAVVLMSEMPQADCVVKERYYQHPLLGITARAAGYVPSRDGPGLVADCVERLVRGRSLIIFPEGTRSPLGRLAPFQRGAAHIALRSGRDPVPVAITCEPPALHHGQPWWDVPERPFELTLRVGKPLRAKEVAGEHASVGLAARALTASLREYLEKRVLDVEA